MKEENENNNKKKRIKEVKVTTLIVAFLILALAALAFFTVMIYHFGWDNSFTKKIEKFIPFPAAIINNQSFISLGDLNSNVQSVRSFYENQDFSTVGLRVDFNTPDGKKRLKVKEKEVLNKMIEDKAVEILARKNGILISQKDADQNVERKLQDYGNRDTVKDNLSRLYGWTLADFEEKIVKPDLYRQELEKIFEKQDTSAAAAKAKIEEAQKALTNGKDFVAVARNYSQGSTAQDGGELGWFKKDQLIAELSTMVFNLAKGKRSDIIESPLGFHIVELEDKKTEDSQDLVKIRQIFVLKKTFADWLADNMKSLKIVIPLKDYYWDTNTESADFRDNAMKDFEKNLINNSQGDASVMF